MALDTKHKNRLRFVMRTTMVAIAVLLLFFALGIPIMNNAIALGIERDLKELPLPPNTEIVESTSAASRLIGNGNGMQYFGAVLLQSDLSLDELYSHYRPYRQGLYDCLVEPQSGSVIRPAGEDLHGTIELAFRSSAEGEGYYILYTWGMAPAWMKTLLDTDLRGH